MGFSNVDSFLECLGEPFRDVKEEIFFNSVWRSFVKVGQTMARSIDGCQTNFERYINKVDYIIFTIQIIRYSKDFKLLYELL